MSRESTREPVMNYQLSFPEFDVSVFKAIFHSRSFKDFQSDQIQRSSRRNIHCSLRMQECRFEFNASYRTTNGSFFKDRKIPKISPSMYKPPQTRNAKNPPLNRPSKCKHTRGLVLGNCPQIQIKTKKKR